MHSCVHLCALLDVTKTQQYSKNQIKQYSFPLLGVNKLHCPRTVLSLHCLNIWLAIGEDFIKEFPHSSYDVNISSIVALIERKNGKVKKWLQLYTRSSFNFCTRCNKDDLSQNSVWNNQMAPSFFVRGIKF